MRRSQPDPPGLEVYGQPAADDLRRITVDGSANASNYVRFTVAGNSADGGSGLSCEKVTLNGKPRRRRH